MRLSGGVFRPGGPAPVPPPWFQPQPERLRRAGKRYLVAITRFPLTRADRERLEEAGAELLGYLPVHGYPLRLAPENRAAVESLPFVAWLGEIPAHFKASPGLGERAGQGGPPLRIRVILHPGEPQDRVFEALEGLAVASSPSGKEGAWRVEATVPSGRLAAGLSALTGLPEVEAVEEVRPIRRLNQDAVWVHQSFVGPSPQETPIFARGIFGCGQTIGLADTGQDFDACPFADPLHGPPPVSVCTAAPCPAAAPDPAQRKDVIYYNWSGSFSGDDDTCPGFGGTGHGTHTSGSAAGDRSPYADCASFTSPGRDSGDGQAPGARLVIQELGDGLEYLNNLGGTVWNLADVAWQSGARIVSFSWGGGCSDLLGGCTPGCTLPYDSLARDADLAMWTYPDLLLVHSAGNAGGACPPPDAVSTPAIAKSPLSVGAVGHGTSADSPSPFSSPGPVFDGRLKPTVAAQGESVVSAASDPFESGNCDVCSLDGTSMAAPTAAGLAALVREYYTAGFLAAGVRDPGQGIVPTGALVKATLIDGAFALGAGAPAPDFESGYGRLLLASTLAFAGGPFRLRVDDHRDGITTGSVVNHAFDVAGGQPFRATLAWADYPAALNAAVARVNELQLEVVDPAGDVWFQTLDPGTGLPVQTAVPADPHDPVNVEERIAFDNPAPGRYVVRVRGVDVPWDPQPFALVVRGALTDCPAPAAPGAPALASPADFQVQVSWNSVTGAASYNVYRSSSACPGGPWVPVAAGLTGTSFLDTVDSGAVPYSYYVTAASDPGASCESPPSPCAAAVPAGDCTLAPEFAGVRSATSANAGACTVRLEWDPAGPLCGAAVRYNVYRSPAGGFTPAAGNRIARCLLGSSFLDSVDLGSGNPYHYVVRAEDATQGHGGPCVGGNEDGNTVEAVAFPAGPISIGAWSDDAGDTGAAKLQPASPWTVALTGGDSGPRVYTVPGSAGVCADLTTPTLTLGDIALGPQLTFTTRHDLEYEPDLGAGSVGQVEIALGPGFTNWTRVPLMPDYRTVTQFITNNCPTTQTFQQTYFAGTDPIFSAYAANLTNWAGGDVKIRFHLSGDIFFPGGNWWVDDIEVSETQVPGACMTAAAGPPPVPDGGPVPGEPLRVAPAGDDLLLTWDATRCPAAAVNVYYGVMGDFSAFTGGFCNLPPTGSAVLALPDNAWFLVAATDGGPTDGSWSRDAAGLELTYGGASLACPGITLHVTNNACP